MYDISTGIERQISSSPGQKSEGAIYEDKVVWKDGRYMLYNLMAPNTDIFMSDLSTGEEFQITQNDLWEQRDPDIYGDKIVWTDYKGIHLYDLSMGGELLIESGDIDAFGVRDSHIYDDKIVYATYYTSGYGDIYYATLFYVPQVSSISSNMVSIGNLITITGNDFGRTQEDSKVEFSRNLSAPLASASIVSWSDTSITCIVPQEAITGPVKVVTPGGESNAIAITILPGSLVAPSNLTANYASGNIYLTWQDNSGGETGFTIERSTSSSGSFFPITNVGANVASYTDINPTPGTYYYRVYAYVSTENSPSSNVAFATTVPAAPSIVNSIYPKSESTVLLTWQDNSDNETGFKIERSLSSTGGFSQIATVDPNVTTYLDTGLTSGTTYYYRVRAYNSSGDSPYSNTAATAIPVPPLAAPSNLIATANSANCAVLTWQDNTSNETGFKICRGKAHFAYSLIATVGANVKTYTDTGLEPGVKYYYAVYSYNASGNSLYSNETVITAVAGVVAPSSLVATANSTNGIVLTWQDNSNNESGFKIERQTLFPISEFTQIATVGANIKTYTNTNLTVGTTYYYRVRAYNSSGNSFYSNVSSDTVTSSAAPSNLTAKAGSASSIALTWKDNSDNESGFKIERSTAPTSSFTQIKTVAANTTTYTNTGLSSGVTYYYRIRAYNNSGDSFYSNVASDTTAVAIAPSNLAAIDNDSSSQYILKLTWQDNSNNESGFKIERSTTSPTSGFTQIAAVGANIITYFYNSTSSPGPTCYYRICAYNNLGNSSYSNVTSPVHDVTPPTGTISINYGAPVTDTTLVNLQLFATDSGGGIEPSGQMQFSNDDTNWSTAEPYAITKSWTLSTGGGTKTVYVKFKDSLGNWSQAYSDTIILTDADIVVLPGEFIQSAVNSASQGNDIFVCSGIYAEEIHIQNKDITLLGEDATDTVIKGDVSLLKSDSTIEKLSVLYKDSNFVSYSDAHYDGFEIITDAGITAINSAVIVKGCIIMPDPDIFGPDKFGKGIQIWNLYGTTDIMPIIENTEISNAMDGIYLYSQAFGGAILGEIKNNTLDNNNYGIVLRMHKEKPLIQDNEITNSIHGIHITYEDGTLLEERLNNIINNTFSGNTDDIWCDERGE